MTTATKLKSKDYRTARDPIWCAGCGDYGVLNAFTQTLAELEIEPHRLALISGIGCSSRLPYFVDGYCYHGVHGRALPTAQGVKLANPDLTVVAMGGDGDLFSIGTAHLPHCARRNPDITLILMDNHIYGLTKGQVAPTSPVGATTMTSPHGSLEAPINPTALMIACETTFVARGYAGNPKQLKDIFVRAMRHPGFAFVDVLSPCVNYQTDMTHQALRPLVEDIPEDHDPTDRAAAFAHALDPRPLMGVFVQTESVPFEKRIADTRARLIEHEGKGEIGELLRSYR